MFHQAPKAKGGRGRILNAATPNFERGWKREGDWYRV